MLKYFSETVLQFSDSEPRVNLWDNSVNTSATDWDGESLESADKQAKVRRILFKTARMSCCKPDILPVEFIKIGSEVIAEILMSGCREFVCCLLRAGVGVTGELRRTEIFRKTYEDRAMCTDVCLLSPSQCLYDNWVKIKSVECKLPSPARSRPSWVWLHCSVPA